LAFDIKEVAPDIFQIDDEVVGVPGLGAVYLVNEDCKALVDCGPTSSADTVIRALKSLGVKPEEIDYIIVSHVHLDHAGGAGKLLESMPRAKVVVHRRGAKHLEDPEKLVASATIAQGIEIINRYGRVVPVAASRLWPVVGGESIPLGDSQTLKIIEAPGHAPHELCVSERYGGVFVGDTFGLYFEDSGRHAVIQVHPPPSLDIEVCLETVEKIKDLRPERLYFAHFGTASQAGEVIGEITRQLRGYLKLAQDAVSRGRLDGLEKVLRERITRELEPLKGKLALYQFVWDYLVSAFVEGFLEYCRKKQKSMIVGEVK
jgi:glyoxylase-like metal-dependent hydrolase (beta-lactamase superfamily II)